MATVKISELPSMQTIADDDLLAIVDTSETETKKVSKEMLLSDIDANEIAINDLMEADQINDDDLLIIVQDGTNKKISKANARFASGDEISIGTTTPVEEEVLWIDPSEAVSGEGSYISNEYGESQTVGYSQEYVNSEVKGTVLYDNSTGSNGNITLSDNVSNYEYIEIFYRNHDSRYSCIKIPSSATSAGLSIMQTGGDGAFYINNKVIEISTNQIFNSGARYSSISITPNVTLTNVNNIYITKVVGYK